MNDFSDTSLIPDGAIKVDVGGGMDCPHCKNPLRPEVVNYFRRTIENPDHWRISHVFALFQCVACKGMYYVDHTEEIGEW